MFGRLVTREEIFRREERESGRVFIPRAKEEGSSTTTLELLIPKLRQKRRER